MISGANPSNQAPQTNQGPKKTVKIPIPGKQAQAI